MSPTAHSSSPARICSSVSRNRADGSRPTVSRPRSDRLVRRPAATSSAAGGQLLAAPEGDGEPGPGVVLDPLDLHAGAHVDALVGHRLGDHRARLRLLGTEDPVRDLEDGDVALRTGRTPARSRSRSLRRRARSCCPGRFLTCTASRLVQYGVSASPLDGRDGGRRADVEHDAHVCTSYSCGPSSVSTTTLPGPASRPWPRANLAPLSISRSTATWSFQASVASSEIRFATVVQSGVTSTEPPSVGTRLASASASGRADHHLRGDAPVVGTLTAHQVLLHAQHGEAGLRELSRDVLPSRAETDDGNVDALAHGDSLARGSLAGNYLEAPVVE